jgi:hypothetical protein
VTNMRSTHADFLDRLPLEPPAAVASLVVGQHAVAGAYTNPEDGSMHPLDRLVMLGDTLTEVPLCAH